MFEQKLRLNKLCFVKAKIVAILTLTFKHSVSNHDELANSLTLTVGLFASLLSDQNSFQHCSKSIIVMVGVVFCLFFLSTKKLLTKKNAIQCVLNSIYELFSTHFRDECLLRDHKPLIQQ